MTVRLFIVGMWRIELAELVAFSSADSRKAKSFFTRREDRYS